MAMKKKRVEFLVRGRVQGVWFRYETQKKALELGLCGFVENLADGSVYGMAEGDELTLERLVEYVRVGPPLAKVDGVDTRWGEATEEFSGFTIRH
jgi:acylphosphatase